MKTLLSLCMAIVTSGLLSAQQPGFIDAGFKTGGGANQSVNALLRQKDGKLLVAGRFTALQNRPRNRIARVLGNGSLDLSFNPGTGADSEMFALALQPDGRVLIGGEFTSYNGTQRNHIARLNSDGSLDASFSPVIGADNILYAIVVQPDGRLLIGGEFDNYEAIPRSGIARVNADGSLDTSFNPGTGFNGNVNGIALLADGRMLVAGEFTSFNGTACNRIARLNSNGTLDATFNPGGTGLDSEVRSMALQPDGRILLAGIFTQANGTTRNRIARLNADGSLDASFNPGTGFNNQVNTLALQSDGRMLVGGHFSNVNGVALNCIARLSANGTLDATFNPGSGMNSGVRTLLVQPDSRIVAGGDFNTANDTARNHLALLTAGGSVDPTFNMGAGANSNVHAITPQSDGRILIGGSFTKYAGLSRNRIARLNADGTLDATFQVGTGADDYVLDLSVQPDGRIVFGGNVSIYNGTAIPHLGRLNRNGSLDLTFNQGLGADGYVDVITQQADGKILVAGNFTTMNGTSRVRIARLYADGSLDPSFDPGAGTDNSVRALAIQPNGKILVAGFFINCGGSSRPRIARLNSDGSLDTSFNPGTGASGPTYDVVVQPDGKILLGGFFTTFNGNSVPSIVRLNADGSIDTSFNTGTGPSSSLHDLALQPDGRIVITGGFTSVAGVPRQGIARLNADGSLDASFDPGLGAEEGINVLALQADGKALIGGGLTSYDGTVADHITRLHLGYAHTPTPFTGTTTSLNLDNATLFGRAALSLTGTGSFSGSLNTGIETVSFTGAFDQTGRTLITTTRKDKTMLFLSLALTRGSSGGPMVEGEVSDFAGRRASLEVHPPFFSTSLLPANHFSGMYHLGLQGTPTEGLLPVSGHGWLTCIVSTAGTVNFVGKAGDGTTLSGSNNLNQDGTLLLHLPMYAGKGFLNGSATIDDSTFNSSRHRQVTGNLLWLRPPGAPYPLGFAQPVPVTGSVYRPMPAGVLPFGNSAPDSNGLNIYGGHLPAARPLSSLFAFTTAGVGVIKSGNLSSLHITLNRVAGTFTGTFLPPGATKPVALQGVLNSRTEGMGYALVTSGGVVRPAAVLLEALP